MSAPAPSKGVDGLPTWHELVAAFRGWDAVCSNGHPVVRCACGLARLHRKRCAGHRRELIAQRRAALINAIDAWADAHVRRSAPTGESFGVCVDRMAAASATAANTLWTCPPSEEVVHAAWTTLAVLATQWDDITLGAVCPYSRTPRELP